MLHSHKKKRMETKKGTETFLVSLLSLFFLITQIFLVQKTKRKLNNGVFAFVSSQMTYSESKKEKQGTIKESV